MIADDLPGAVVADRMHNTAHTSRYGVTPVTEQNSVWDLLQASRRRDADWLERNSKGGEQ